MNRVSPTGIAKYVLGAIGVVAVAFCISLFFTHPSLTRDWSPDQALLAHAEIAGDSVAIHNIRNITYRSTTDYDVHYYDKTFDLSKLESVWYMVEPFAGHGVGAAHTLVSFGFEGGEYVAVSAEIRKKKGEIFSPIKGLLRWYEIVYVIADERDVIKLRSNYRKDDVFLYPLTMSREEMQQLFVSMLTRANQLSEKPEFYNTITNACATNIVSHLNDVLPTRISWSYKILLPEYSDELLHDAGLIAATGTIEELRTTYRINDKAMKFADDPLFSQRIREE